MSSLTEEQRKKIELNRQAALQRRAQSQQKQQQQSTTVNLNTNSSNVVQPSFRSYSAGAPSVSQSMGGQSVQKYPNSTSFNKHSSYPSSVNKPMTQTTFGTRGLERVISGTCRLVAKDRFVVDMPYQTQAINIFKSVQGGSYDMEKKRWSFPLTQHGALLTAMECLRPSVVLGALPSNVLRVFRNLANSSPVNKNIDLSSIDPVLVRMLMPFQRDGIIFGIRKGGRLLIADDMGLGKTIQALGIAHFYGNEWPLLIVCPSSMKYVWRESIWNWLPSVNPGSINILESLKDSVQYAKVIIVSYDMVTKKKDELPRCGVIIVDESHNLKNFKTARAKAVMPLIKNAKRALLLSGTPALSRPNELYNQISSINRSVFPDYNEFGIRYCNGKKNAWGWDFSGSSNMEELQLILEESVMIRRLKADVLSQLPAKRRQMMILDPSLVRAKSKSLQATANAFSLGSDTGRAMEKRGKLLEYYAETGLAKLDAVIDYIKQFVEDGKKFIVFAYHHPVMDGISEALESMNCRYIRIDGTTTSEERNGLCEEFQLNDSVLVAVLSIAAANSGITLTAASLVVFAELFWNPGILTQAEDRAHRIGQMDSVLVQYLVAKGTADDVLWPLVQNKLDVLNKAGLSKDNFRDADATMLTSTSQDGQSGPLPSQSQTTMHNFFSSISTPSPSQNQNSSNAESSTNTSGGDEWDSFFDNDVLAALQESFEESQSVGSGPNAKKPKF